MPLVRIDLIQGKSSEQNQRFYQAVAEIDLAARIKKGDREARALMIKANLRLVVKIAQDYANLALPLLDLVSEGNIGLMKAIERFDPAKSLN
jgi:DNA-directed RNA polymerase sigma subunit (sigma70/sigma32)